MNAKHSPLPWRLIENSAGGATLVRGNGDWRAHAQSHLQIVPREDAEFIVRAVNAHEELLAALKQAIDVHCGQDACTSKVHAIWRAAIAKAEGR